MELDVNEALRYLGAGTEPPPELRQRAAELAARLTERIRPRWVYRVFALTAEGETMLLPGAALELTGRTAEKMLSGCSRAALLGCTLGPEFDALLRREQVRDMADAVILDACGSAWVEAGCDAAQAELAARLPGFCLTDRFSPGYGDLPLDLQPALCAALGAEKRIGLHVTASMMLDPVKSVTAVIGISDTPRPARVRGCAYCSMGGACALRKRGEHCGL